MFGINGMQPLVTESLPATALVELSCVFASPSRTLKAAGRSSLALRAVWASTDATRIGASLGMLRRAGRNWTRGVLVATQAASAVAAVLTATSIITSQAANVCAALALPR